MVADLTVVDQRHKAVIEVLEHGAKVIDVAARYWVAPPSGGSPSMKMGSSRLSQFQAGLPSPDVRRVRRANRGMRRVPIRTGTRVPEFGNREASL